MIRGGSSRRGSGPELGLVKEQPHPHGENCGKVMLAAATPDCWCSEGGARRFCESIAKIARRFCEGTGLLVPDGWVRKSTGGFVDVVAIGTCDFQTLEEMAFRKMLPWPKRKPFEKELLGLWRLWTGPG